MNQSFTETSLAKLQQERNSLFDSHNNIITPAMEARKVVHVNNMRQMSKSGNRSFSLLDLHAGRFTHHFSAYSKLLHHASIQPDHADNWKEANRLCHPDDIAGNTETDILFYRQLMELTPDQQLHFVMLCLRRMRNKNNEFNIYLLRTYVIDMDDNRMPWLVVVESELMSQFNPKNYYPNRQYFLLNEHDNFIQERFEEYSTELLTKQQYEVLDLACNHLSTEKMAKKLFITTNTIKSHRSQIIEKLNAPTLTLACLMAVNLRLIEKKKTENAIPDLEKLKQPLSMASNLRA